MAKNKTGRPRREIDYKTLDNLCMIMCTGEEIAAILEMDMDTLNACLKRDGNETFSVYFQKKSSNGKMSLRRMQFKKAVEGNPTMLIWMGKQILGQSDKAEVETTVNAPQLNINLTNK